MSTHDTTQDTLFQLPRIAKPSGTFFFQQILTGDAVVSTSPDSKTIRNPTRRTGPGAHWVMFQLPRIAKPSGTLQVLA